MESYPFVLIDVFTDTPLAGNPLAVVLGAEGLDAERMQALAREFNLSETTFVLQPRSLEATRRLRSFSPIAEVFGAGHNALGAWWAVLARGDVPLPEGETTLWQELGERVLPVSVTRASGRLRRIAMTQATPRVGPDPPVLDALAQYIVGRERAREGEWLTIEQGDEIRRPSRIEVRVKGERVEVAGRCAVVAEGNLLL